MPPDSPIIPPITPPNIAAKRALRARMREVRSAIVADAAGRAARSRVIGERLVAVISGHLDDTAGSRPPSSRPRVMVYEPLPGEPDLTLLVEWASAGGADVFVPQVAGDDLRVMPGDIDPASLDAVVVPGLAFTTEGHRVGQGGGHFDRFLPCVATSCLRIGVAFREQLVDHVPVEPHDVMMDVVITDVS